MSTNKHLLLNVSGHNSADATEQIVAWLVARRLQILNIRQSVVQGQLSLMAWIACTPDSVDQLHLELTAKAGDLSLHAYLTPLPKPQAQSSTPSYILTLLAWELAGQMLAELMALVVQAGLSVEAIRQLSRMTEATASDELQPVCVELSLTGEPDDMAGLRAALLAFAGRSEVDVAFQRNDLFRRYRRLVVFDMDSTLIKNEVIDELAMVAGVADQVSAITASAMNGELPFQESLIRRVKLLEGLSVEKLEDVAKRLTLTPGAARLMRILRQLGMSTAIISGGFQYFGQHIQRQLGIDYLYANDLDVAEGRLTGLVRGTVIDAQGKAEALRQIVQEEKLDLRQTVAVGDGANDLPMLATAGLGIAYHAKAAVKKAAHQAISTHGLDGILYLLGIHDFEVEFLEQ